MYLNDSKCICWDEVSQASTSLVESDWAVFWNSGDDLHADGGAFTAEPELNSYEHTRPVPQRLTTPFATHCHTCASVLSDTAQTPP